VLEVFAATFVFVLTAEVVGDKLLYTTGVLATRYPVGPIAFGVGMAFMAKMGLAVVAGTLVGRLSPLIVASMSAISFLGVALAFWRSAEMPVQGIEHAMKSRRVALISFAAILFSEWGDVGQIAAATMAARYARPLLVWAGAVTALACKGALAASVGSVARKWIRERIPAPRIRVAATAAVLVVGMFSVVEILTRRN